jgi:hypothetical protein
MAATAEATLRGMLLFRLSPESKTRDFLAYKSEITASDVLRAFAAFKPKDLADILIKHLADPDVVVRGTAADLLGDLPPSEQITLALAAALPRTEKDPFNDAALSTLDALGKQKSEAANKAIMSVLGWRDHLVRRRAVKILKDNGVGDLSSISASCRRRIPPPITAAPWHASEHEAARRSDYHEGFVYY